MNIKIVSRWDSSKVLLSGEYKSIKDCLGKNRSADLYGADLSDIDLSGADLYGAYLSHANLSGVDLYGAKNYFMSHDFAQEIIRRQKIDHFTDTEWSFIGKCLIHRFCYETIRKYYSEVAESIFKKLEKLGYGEYLTKFHKVE